MDISKFIEECVNSHNKYRETHAADPLILDPTFTAQAQEWADHMARTNKLGHSGNEGLGENVASVSNKNPTGDEICKMWYDEVKYYNFGSPGFEGNTGHFTQVVWKGSTHVGIGIARSDDWTFVVANYSPPGNYTNPGSFETNVLPENSGHESVAEPSSDDMDISKFIEECVNSHNKYRGNHAADPLILDPTISAKSQEWADHMAGTNKLGHSGNKGFGENVASVSNRNPTGDEICKMWYDEVEDYNFGNPGFDGNTGHFTQVVWKGSTHVGIGIARSKDWTFVVANYSPPGNYTNPGYFEKNVLPKNSGHGSDENSEDDSDSEDGDNQLSRADQRRFRRDCLERHNEYRRIHRNPLFRQNNDLQKAAQKHANQMLKQKLTHTPNPQYGKNLYHVRRVPVPTGAQICDSWYNEIQDYDFRNSTSHGKMTDHFTQVVWEKTRYIGIGVASKDGITYVAAYYDPPGNIEGQLERNVFRARD